MMNIRNFFNAFLFFLMADLVLLCSAQAMEDSSDSIDFSGDENSSKHGSQDEGNSSGPEDQKGLTLIKEFDGHDAKISMSLGVLLPRHGRIS